MVFKYIVENSKNQKMNKQIVQEKISDKNMLDESYMYLHIMYYINRWNLI
jgi:hypothetical protein